MRTLIAALIAAVVVAGCASDGQKTVAVELAKTNNYCAEWKIYKHCFSLGEEWDGTCKKEKGSCVFLNRNPALQLIVINKIPSKTFEKKAAELADLYFKRDIEALIDGRVPGVGPCQQPTVNRLEPVKSLIAPGDFARVGEVGPRLEWSSIQAVQEVSCVKDEPLGKWVLSFFHSKEIPRWMFIAVAGLKHGEPDPDIFRGRMTGPIYRSILAAVSE